MLAEKLFDVGNLALGALVFGQFIGGQTISLRLIGAGALTWTAFLVLSVLVAREIRR